MIRFASIVAVFLAAAPAVAETPIALVGGTVHRVSGATIDGATVIIRGERIVAVGKDLPLASGANVIDCRGKQITPGLIEASTQLGLVEVWAMRTSVDAYPVSPDPIRAAVDVSAAIDVRGSPVGVARRHGVTSAIATPGGGLISGQSAWFDLLDGRSPKWTSAVLGPVAMNAQLGAGGAGVSGGSRATAMARFREVLDDARTLQRDATPFRRNQLRKLVTSRLDLVAMQAVAARRQPILISVHRAADILAVLEMAKRERIDIVLTGAAEGWLVADHIAAARVPVILTPLENLPRRFESKNARSDNATLLAQAGVKIGLTTGTTHNTSSLRFELGNAVRAGLPRDVALRAATLSIAEIFGQGRTHGAVDRARVANVVVWTGDPFEPSSYAETVIIRGEIQTVENRQTQLRDRYKVKLGL